MATWIHEFEATIEIEGWPGGELDVLVEAEIDPYIPAKISGPPERCYPAEGGYAVVLGVWALTDPDKKENLLRLLDEKTELMLEEKAYEEATAEQEPDPDAERDARIDREEDRRAHPEWFSD